MDLNIIVAVCNNGGIGRNGQIPWKSDLAYFRKITTGSTIIMGRKTWESIGSKPLSNRNNLVVGTGYYASLKNALLAAPKNIPIFVIGGYRLYQECFSMPDRIDKIYVTRIQSDYECDVFFDLSWLDNFHLFSSEINDRFIHEIYRGKKQNI